MSNVDALIRATAAKYNLDPVAWAAIIHHESGGNPNAIGDGGTSFGLTQEHVGGSLGNISLAAARAYLNPQKNLELAGSQMAKMGLGGLRGAQAIAAYSKQWERPSNPAAEIADALKYYNAHKGDSSLTSGTAPTSAMVPQVGQSNSLQSQQNNLVQTLMAGTSPYTNQQSVNQQTMDLINAFGNGGLSAKGAPASQPLGNGVVSDVKGMMAPNAPKVVQMAKQYMGTKYVWGGTTPAGFDCSGFVQYLYAKQGIKLPRTTYEQIKVGQHIDRKNLQPGDIVFFSDNGNVHHEGLYIGNNQFIHAPHTGDVVKISSLNEPYYAQQFAGGRRV